MTRKNFIYRFIAFLLVFNLSYVQTVMISHQSHHNTQHSHDSSSTQLDASTLKCVVCDYVFNHRSEPALLGSAIVLTIFTKSVVSINSEEVIHSPRIFYED